MNRATSLCSDGQLISGSAVIDWKIIRGSQIFRWNCFLRGHYSWLKVQKFKVILNNMVSSCTNEDFYKRECNRPFNVDIIPDEILIEIFKWIPFDDLHRNIMPVCRLWRKIITAHYRYPRVLVIKDSSKIHRITNLTIKYSSNILMLKISDAFDSWVMACLKKQRWPNLRALIIESRWTTFDRADVNVDDLNYMIDCSSKLRQLKIRECSVKGDIESLLDRMKRSKLTKFALVNRYLVLENVETLYALKNMKKFQVYCHFFSLNDISTTLDTFFSNNLHSLTSLALYVHSDEADIISTKVASCRQLTKLILAGRYRFSLEGLVSMTSLPKMRSLKLEVSSFLSSKVFTQFLRHESVRKLHSLEVLWHRLVDWGELTSLLHCSRQLNKLSLGFWDDDCDLIVEAVTNLVKQSTNLRDFKILFTNVKILTILPTLMSHVNLVYIKFVLLFRAIEQEETPDKEHIEEWVSTVVSLHFNYEYLASDVDFRITLRRKTL